MKNNKFKINDEERFEVKEIYITPIKIENDSVLINMDYPSRLCVIDKENLIVVDVEDKLKYDYLKSTAGYVKIKDDYDYINNRVAIMPLCSFENHNNEETEEIIKALKNNGDYINGNNFFNNEDYLKHIKEESVKTKKDKEKTKTKKYFNK